MTADQQTDPPALAMSGVGVSFGGLRALDGVDLTVRAGEVAGVIGPNGAGKTTLFNVACGFAAPTTGTVSWHGEDVTSMSTHRRARLGMTRTLQGLGLFEGLSVLDNVMVGLDRTGRVGLMSSLMGLPRSTREERLLRERATEALERLGVAEHRHRHPGALPYGVRKRVALARALASEPQVLLLDEPASGLSEDEMDELATLIASMSTSMSIVLVEHHMELVMAVCTHLTVLDFGKVIARGNPDEVRRDPAVLAAYLGDEAPSADAS